MKKLVLFTLLIFSSFLTYATKDTVYIDFNYYSDLTVNLNVKINDTLFVINHWGTNKFTVDTNTIFDYSKPIVLDSNICEYVINKNSIEVNIQEYFTPADSVNILFTVINASINDISNSNYFEIYPNPVNDIVNINSPVNIAKIDIENLMGQSVYSGNYDTKKVLLDVSTLASGVYFIRINDIYVKKIVKE